MSLLCYGPVMHHASLGSPYLAPTRAGCRNFLSPTTHHHRHLSHHIDTSVSSGSYQPSTDSWFTESDTSGGAYLAPIGQVHNPALQSKSGHALGHPSPNIDHPYLPYNSSPFEPTGRSQWSQWHIGYDADWYNLAARRLSFQDCVSPAAAFKSPCFANRPTTSICSTSSSNNARLQPTAVLPSPGPRVNIPAFSAATPPPTTSDVRCEGVTTPPTADGWQLHERLHNVVHFSPRLTSTPESQLRPSQHVLPPRCDDSFSFEGALQSSNLCSSSSEIQCLSEASWCPESPLSLSYSQSSSLPVVSCTQNLCSGPFSPRAPTTTSFQSLPEHASTRHTQLSVDPLSVSDPGPLHVRTRQKYACHLCNKSYVCRRNLKFHMKACHSNLCVRGQTCLQCFITFTHPSSLILHMRSHTGEKPYACTFCRRTFADPSVWRRHERTHTGERPFKCHQCDYSSNQSGNLKRHIKKIH